MRVRIIKEVIKKQSCVQADGDKGKYVAVTSKGDMCYKTSREAYGVHNNLKEAREEIPRNLSPEESEMLLADVDTNDAIEILKLKGFKNLSEINRGMGGAVLKGEVGGMKVAIKVFDASDPLSMHEKNIYNKINSIRNKKPVVAKHFPEVYNLKNLDSNKFVFVVMELLTSDSSAMQTVHDTFSGMEQAHLNLPIEKLVQLANDQGIPVGYTEKIKRMEDKIRNDEAWGKIIDDFLFQFNFIYNLERSEIDKIKANLFLARNWLSNKNASRVARKYSEIETKLREVENKIDADVFKKGLNYFNNLLKEMKDDIGIQGVIMSLFTGIMGNFINFQNAAGVNKPKTEDFMKQLLNAAQGLFKEYRKSPLIKAKYDKPPSEEEIEASSPAISSILKAVQGVAEEGIILADMHDANALIRPSDGSIVIADVGNFAEEDKYEQMKQWIKERTKRRYDKIRELRAEREAEHAGLDAFWGSVDSPEPAVNSGRGIYGIDTGSMPKVPSNKTWRPLRESKMKKIKVFIGKR